MPEDIAAFLQIEAWPPRANFALWAALAIVGGALLGEVARRSLGLPRIVGYSVVGAALGLLGVGVGDIGLTGTTRLVVDLALALLLFELGSRVNLRWLQKNPALLATGVCEALFAGTAVYAALRWFGLAPNVALTCAAMAVCTSGAIVGRVAGELEAAGQVTERMIVLTALNTLAAVLVLKLVIGWLHVDQAGDWVRAVSQPLWAFGGSVLLAALLAWLVAIVARRLELRDENAALLLLGLVVLALLVARALNLSTLLVPLLAGVLLRNTHERPWVWPRHFGTAGGVLVLMLFVIVGSSLSTSAIAGGALAALLLLAARGAAKAVAVLVFARFSGISVRQGGALALTLTPVGATALVLLTDLQLTHPGFAPQVAPLMLSVIAIGELVGPLAVQWGLRLAGDHQPLVAPRAPAARLEAAR